MSKLRVLVTIVGVVAFVSCGSDRGKTARFEGWANDFASQSETLEPDGHKDVQIALSITAGPSISRIRVRNVDGQPSLWDTTPNNVNWALGVADRNKPEVLLNHTDGSILIPAKEPSELLLYLADNGAFRGGQTRFEVVVTREGGQETSYPVER